MVENVEKFDTQVESIILVDYGTLRYTEIGVVEPRAMEEVSIDGSKGSQGGVRFKRIRQKIASSSGAWNSRIISWAGGIHLARIDDLNRAYLVGHICGPAARQGNIVIRLVHLNGKP